MEFKRLYYLSIIKSLLRKEEFKGKVPLNDFLISKKVIIFQRRKKKVNFNKIFNTDIKNGIFNYLRVSSSLEDSL